MECKDDEFKCHEAWENPDGFIYGWNWCQDMPCPPVCDEETEQLCYDGATQSEICHPKDEACPITCGPEENKCIMKDAWCADCDPYVWCNAKEYPCPPVCEDSEMVCWIAPPPDCWEKEEYWNLPECQSSEECHPKDKGCPVTCWEDELTCTQKSGDYVWQYCHKGQECPPTCETGEMSCWNPGPPGTEGEDIYTCVEMYKEDGSYNFCPVTCYDPDVKCTSEWGDYCMNPEWGECYS